MRRAAASHRSAAAAASSAPPELSPPSGGGCGWGNWIGSRSGSASSLGPTVGGAATLSLAPSRSCAPEAECGRYEWRGVVGRGGGAPWSAFRRAASARRPMTCRREARRQMAGSISSASARWCDVLPPPRQQHRARPQQQREGADPGRSHIIDERPPALTPQAQHKSPC